jgi:hypothetical protein
VVAVPEGLIIIFEALLIKGEALCYGNDSFIRHIYAHGCINILRYGGACIPWFAQRSEALQNRKTALLCQGPPQNSARKNYTVKILIGNPTEFEIESFNSIQEAWDGNTFLYHFDPNLRPYADVDASKE